jgi:hypothetical protein
MAENLSQTAYWIQLQALRQWTHRNQRLLQNPGYFKLVILLLYRDR